MEHQANPPIASPLDELLIKRPMPSLRVAAWPIMILITVVLTWANFAKLDEVSVAMGKVVPLGKTKVVQHLEGGIVQEIYVSEGDTVSTGQPLLLLDLASGGTNREELQVRLDSELAARSRLQAEAEGRKLKFPRSLESRQPALVEAQRQAHDARQRELKASISVLKEQIKQRELDVKELLAKKKALERNYSLARERLSMSASLLAEGLTARIEHLKLEAEVEDLDGELKGLVPAIPRSQAAVEEAKKRVSESEEGFRREAREELNKVEQSIARIQELITEAERQGSRSEIKSPINGIVQKMVVNTVGGVVKPGEPILEIVPTGDKLVVEARLNPTERGFIVEGQPAVVKISTYDFVRYGGLDGMVISVAPDASTDENGAPYFRVVVQTEKTYLGQREGLLPITPGMEATVDIHTGRKSVMDYLIKPVLKLKDEAFRER
ncbi:MAG TPA: HlyD family type I secretion periplasmic adaptor subunit [Rhodospirillaceae bacterium]|nr:HlyD family type I secretion periplasmic adaptor subunit [Rhodospirillaceae bacterium]